MTGPWNLTLYETQETFHFKKSLHKKDNVLNIAERTEIYTVMLK